VLCEKEESCAGGNGKTTGVKIPRPSQKGTQLPCEGRLVYKAEIGLGLNLISLGLRNHKPAAEGQLLKTKKNHGLKSNRKENWKGPANLAPPDPGNEAVQATVTKGGEKKLTSPHSVSGFSNPLLSHSGELAKVTRGGPKKESRGQGN